MTDEELRVLILSKCIYDQARGQLLSLGYRTKMRAGEPLGKTDKVGDVRVKFCRTSYFLKEVVWLIETGALPTDFVAHIDEDRSNCQFSNLRLATERRVSDHEDLETFRSVLDQRFYYEPDTGLLRRRVSSQRKPAGSVVGGPDAGGYIVAKVDDKVYKVHRLIWLIVYGRWPVLYLDHKDGDPGNNRIDNLREADAQENSGNHAGSCLTRSGVRGVSLTAEGRFVARIKLEGKSYHLGSYTTLDEARARYLEVAERCFGEFAFHNRSGK